MNARVRALLIVALLALAATTFAAPYRYAGHTVLDVPGYWAHHQPSGTIYRPMWIAPDQAMLGVTLTAPRESPYTVDSLALDSGRLELWWLGIALVTGVLAALTWGHPTKDTA